MRGDRLKAEKTEAEGQKTDEITILDISDYRSRRIPSPTWRECIKKIWEVDPLECPRCHAEMKIISFINEPQMIEKILRHLDLWKEEQTAKRASRAPPERRVIYEPLDDGWPEYEEPHISVQ